MTVLARLVGVENVVSVEIDAEVARSAEAALASVHTVPYAWGRQVRPGGLIVVPLAATVHPEWPLAVLRVNEDGTAQGRCVVPAPFMPLRSLTVEARGLGWFVR